MDGRSVLRAALMIGVCAFGVALVALPVGERSRWRAGAGGEWRARPA